VRAFSGPLHEAGGSEHMSLQAGVTELRQAVQHVETGSRLVVESERHAQPKLTDLMWEALRSRHYSRRTEQTYCQRVKRFIRFHGVRHPAQMTCSRKEGLMPIRIKSRDKPARWLQAATIQGHGLEFIPLPGAS
jgi:hypothetical protein